MTADALKSLDAARQAVTAELANVRRRISELEQEARDLRAAGPHPSERDGLIRTAVEALARKGAPNLIWDRGTLAVEWPAHSTTLPEPRGGNMQRVVGGGAALFAFACPDALCAAMRRELDRCYPPEAAGPPMAERNSRLAQIEGTLSGLRRQEQNLAEVVTT